MGGAGSAAGAWGTDGAASGSWSGGAAMFRRLAFAFGTGTCGMVRRSPRGNGSMMWLGVSSTPSLTMITLLHESVYIYIYIHAWGGVQA